MTRTARIPRCYFDTGLADGARLDLDKRLAHHLSTVLRMRDGDAVMLFNGDGNDYPATLHIDGRRIAATVGGPRRNTCESPLHTCLLQGISRGDRMETTIQKAVELGANRVSPVHTRHAVRPLDPSRSAKKREHWQQVAISALEQCGRASRVAIDDPCGLSEALRQAQAEPTAEHGMKPVTGDNGALSLVLSPEGSTTLAECVGDAGALHTVRLLVGPESGLDEDEVAEAVAAGWQAVTLGPRVLRTETAGIAALAALQVLAGDLA